jgi:two-component system sensor histidine kinase YesM
MQRINDLPIRSKFILLYLLGVLLPIAILLSYVLTNVAAEMRAREALNARLSLGRVYDALNQHFSGAVSLGNAVSADTELERLLALSYESPAVYYGTYYMDIRRTLNRYSLAYAQQVTGIALYTENPTIANGGSVQQITPQVREQEWFPAVLPAEARMRVYLRQQVGQTGILQLCLTRSLHMDGPYSVVLRIDLNMEPVNRLVADENPFLSVYLVAPDGTAVCYPGSMQDSHITDRSVRPPATVDLMVAFGERTAMQGWQLTADINDEPMNQNIREAIWIGLLLGALCSVFAAFMALVFSHSILDRSRRLLRHMDTMTAENFCPITREYGRDEIGELTAHFNAMGSRLKQLINDLYVLRLQKKSMELENVRAELKYLQAQVDPHFLFNTLNALLVLSVRNGHQEEAEIIRALSKILRRMLDTTSDVVPLSTEMAFVHMVLKLERFRFGDKLQYAFDVSEAASARTVPVMSVQGLVENACKHGVQGVNGQGLIRVEARVEADGALVVEVSDNGVGIEPSRLIALQKQIESPQDMADSIGLQNIYRRLSLHYGHAVSLTLRNAEGRGTVVMIRIPQTTEE